MDKCESIQNSGISVVFYAMNIFLIHQTRREIKTIVEVILGYPILKLNFYIRCPWTGKTTEQKK
jgi:hypothetical protein